MSITFGFYNSSNGDRKYSADQMARIFDGLIADGVFATYGTAMMITATTGMTISVGEGRAWFDHTWTLNDAAMAMIVEEADLVLDRIDMVVLETDSSDENRTNAVKIIKGTPGATPVVPTLVDTLYVKQYPLANIYVGASVTEILTANITNRVGTSECPFVTGIIDTIDVDALLVQWDAEFHDWLTMSQEEFDIWAAAQELEFETWSAEQQVLFEAWFATIQDILDENVAATLLLMIQAIVTDGVGVIPITGWIANTDPATLELFTLIKQLPIAEIVVGDKINMIIGVASRDVASDADICATVVEYNGGVTLYSNGVPEAEIPFDWQVIR